MSHPDIAIGGGEPATVGNHATAGVEEVVAALPLLFELNAGQTAPEVRFLARGRGGRVYLLQDSLVFEKDFPGNTGQGNDAVAACSGRRTCTTSVAVRLRLLGSTPGSVPVGEAPQPTSVSQFRGSDRSRWVSAAPTFGRVRYRNVYPGIDLVVYGTGSEVEFDFEVAPGRSPDAIAIHVEGSDGVGLGPSGEVVVSAGRGECWRLRAPRVYQPGGSGQEELAGVWTLADERLLGFEIAAYDPGRPLIIDPVVEFSTRLGGSGADGVYDVKIDASGNPVVVGGTRSIDFPAIAGVQTPRRENDIFVAKIASDGSHILFTATIGGSDLDQFPSLALDPAGNIIIAATSTFGDYPTVRPIQEFPAGQGDAVVTILDPAGTTILFSTYLGGADYDHPTSVAVDRHGRILVAGTTWSRDFPVTTGAYQTQFRGNSLFDTRRFGDGFVAAIDPEAPALSFATFLGGWDDDRTLLVLPDPVEGILAIGTTLSSDFPLVGAMQSHNEGDFDTTISRLSADGKKLLGSTYLGGYADDFPSGAVLDTAGRLVLAGVTYSPDFPITPSALQTTMTPGGAEAFLARIQLAPVRLQYATFLGGTGEDGGMDVAVDPQGMVWIVGNTDSHDFPTRNAFQPFHSEWWDVFVTRIDIEKSQLLLSSYFGGLSFDEATGVAIDSTGAAYIVGATVSYDFPTLRSLEGIGGGESDGFVAKISSRPAVHPGIFLTPSCSSVLSGQCTPLTVMLSEPQPREVPIDLWVSDNGAPPPYSLSLNPGEQSLAFVVCGGSGVVRVIATLPAELGSARAYAEISVHPQSLSVVPASPIIDADSLSTVTVLLGYPVPYVTHIDLISSAPGTISMPGGGEGRSMFLDPGQTLARFDIVGVAPGGPVTLTAVADGTLRASAQVTVGNWLQRRYMVPAVAHNPGLAGTQWRTDLAVVNPHPHPLALAVWYHSDRPSALRQVTLQPGAVSVWPNVLETLFGIAPGESTQGSLVLEPQRDVVISSRTYNQTAAGTFGQWYPALSEADGIDPTRPSYLPRLVRSGSFRTNIGLACLSPSGCSVAVKLRGPNGAVLGRPLRLQASGDRWVQLTDAFAAAGAGEQVTAYATVEPEHPGKCWVYASLVDNITGDPTTIPAQTPRSPIL